MPSDDLFAERRRKVDELAARGIPAYGVDFTPSATMDEARVILATFGPAEMFQLHGTGVVRRSTQRNVKRFHDQPYVAILVPRTIISMITGNAPPAHEPKKAE